MAKISVFVSNEGTVKVDAQGFTGKSCVDIAEPLERALLGSSRKVELKPEYFQQESREADQRVRE